MVIVALGALGVIKVVRNQLRIVTSTSSVYQICCLELLIVGLIVVIQSLKSVGHLFLLYQN